MIRSNRALSRHHLWLVASQIVGGCSLLSSHHLCDKIVLGFFFFFFSCVPLRPMGCCFFFSLGGMIVREIGQKINKLLMVGFFEYIYIYIGFQRSQLSLVENIPIEVWLLNPRNKGLLNRQQLHFAHEIRLQRRPPARQDQVCEGQAIHLAASRGYSNIAPWSPKMDGRVKHGSI